MSISVNASTTIQTEVDIEKKTSPQAAQTAIEKDTNKKKR